MYVYIYTHNYPCMCLCLPSVLSDLDCIEAIVLLDLMSALVLMIAIVFIFVLISAMLSCAP